jgi:hypothetical protein
MCRASLILGQLRNLTPKHDLRRRRSSGGHKDSFEDREWRRSEPGGSAYLESAQSSSSLTSSGTALSSNHPTTHTHSPCARLKRCRGTWAAGASGRLAPAAASVDAAAGPGSYATCAEGVAPGEWPSSAVVRFTTSVGRRVAPAAAVTSACVPVASTSMILESVSYAQRSQVGSYNGDRETPL